MTLESPQQICRGLSTWYAAVIFPHVTLFYASTWFHPSKYCSIKVKIFFETDFDDQAYRCLSLIFKKPLQRETNVKQI